MHACLGLFIFLLPLSLASSSAVEPEILLSAAYFALLLIFLAVWIIVKGLSFKKLETIQYPAIILSLLLVMAVPFTLNRSNGLWEIAQFATGLILFLVAASLDERGKNRLAAEIVLGALVISLLAIFQYFFGFQLLSDYVQRTNITDPFVLEKIAQRRVFFPFPTPGILGGYLAMVLPLALCSGKRAFFAIPIGLALLLTQSLSALLSLMVILAAFYIWKSRSSKKKAFVLLGLGMVLGGMFALRTSNTHQHLLPSFSAAARLDYWKETLRVISAHPWLGAGFGNFDLQPSRYAHNSFLQLWAETGVAGMAVFIWLWAAIFRNGWKHISSFYKDRQKWALLAGIGIFLVHNLMDFTLFLPAVSFIWWVMLGMFTVPASEEEKEGLANASKQI
jgi:O-antigen ligase